MNKKYFRKLYNSKKCKQQTADVCLQRIQKLFCSLKTKFTIIDCARLENGLQLLKNIRPLKYEQKKPIFQFFLEWSLQSFAFLQPEYSILQILKLTKCKLLGYKLEWKQVWSKCASSLNKLRIARFNRLKTFLRFLTPFYNSNNPVEVLEHFLQNSGSCSQYSFQFVLLFANFSPQTPQAVVGVFLRKIEEFNTKKSLTWQKMMAIFIRISKKTQKFYFEPHIYHFFMDCILQVLFSPHRNQGKDSISRKLVEKNAQLVVNCLGQRNKSSVWFLNLIFEYLSNFIHPFQDNNIPAIFLLSLIRKIWRRYLKEQSYRDKTKDMQQKQANEDPEAEELDSNESEEGQQSEEKQSQWEFEKAERQDQLQNQEESQALKNKYEKMLANPLTEQILECVRRHMSFKFQDIFFVNSKKTIPEIIQYSCLFKPELCFQALELMEKAIAIPHISEERLLVNIKAAVQVIFQNSNLRKALEKIIPLCEAMTKVRHLSDVWPILQIFVQRIPLLDEEDMKQVIQEKKRYFLEEFGLDFNRFYQDYSEAIFQVVKRLLREAEFYLDWQLEQATSWYGVVLAVSYPFFRKRICEYYCELLLENPKEYLKYFWVNKLPKQKQLAASIRGLIDNINPQNKDSLSLMETLTCLLSDIVPLQELNHYIRLFAEKNRYAVPLSFGSFKNRFDIKYFIDCSLNYFKEDPQLSFKQAYGVNSTLQGWKQIQKYTSELIDELAELLKGEICDWDNLNLGDLISKFYASRIEIKQVDKRKQIAQLLQTIIHLNRDYSHCIPHIEDQSKEIVFVQTGRHSWISNQKMKNCIQKIMHNSTFLNDGLLMSKVEELILQECKFRHSETQKKELVEIKQIKKKNKQLALPGIMSLHCYKTMVASKISLYNHSKALLESKKQAAVDFDMLNDVPKLLMAIQDKNSFRGMLGLMVNSDRELELAQFVLDMHKYDIRDKFYLQRCSQIIKQSYLKYYQATEEFFLGVCKRYLGLLEDEDKAVRSLANMTLLQLFSQAQCRELEGRIQTQFRTYLGDPKRQLFWFAIVATILFKPKIQQVSQRQSAFSRLADYSCLLKKLIFNDNHRVRKAAMYLQSTCIKNARQLDQESNEVSCKENQKKSLEEFLETGFLRKAHIGDPLMKDKQLKKKSPYYSFIKKVRLNSDQYKKIWDCSFDFILQNRDNSLAFLVNFHTDSASSISELEMIRTEANKLQRQQASDLVFIFMHINFININLKTLQKQAREKQFGSTFFKYLFLFDSETGFRFFQWTRDYVLKFVPASQSLDNQIMVLTYLNGLLYCYCQKFQNMQPKHQLAIQQLMLSVVTVGIQRYPKLVYRSLLQTFKTPKRLAPFQFLLQHLSTLLQRKIKPVRVAKLRLALLGNSYKELVALLRYFWSNSLQTQNNFLRQIEAYLISYSDVYACTSTSLSQVLNTAQLLQDGKIEVLENKMMAISMRDVCEIIYELQKQRLNKMNENEQLILKDVLESIIGCIHNCLQGLQTSYKMQMGSKWLDMLLSLILSKKETTMDLDNALEELLVKVFEHHYFNRKDFASYLHIILKHAKRMHSFKFTSIMQIAANRPFNFVHLEQDLYKELLIMLLNYQEMGAVYHKILFILYTFLSHRTVHEENWFETLSLQQKVLYSQAILMKSLSLTDKKLSYALYKAPKDRRNIWAKEIHKIRGKRGYLDSGQSQEEKDAWTQIKGYSNNYNYIL